ncbi:histidine kinase [Pedobacter sp. HMWF019]|uniref:response regulator n=1 Tax=Pedobacter sp. HMWF019 TaxID=2056856 RepID=UPI000D3C116E|nr:response regulator [Pedobacter sp. HMWF019]PTS95722.1 histidine kinase [Pedobacter sp. HMWF019]
MIKLSFKQQVLTGFAVSLLFVLFSAVTSYLSIESFDKDSNWENHTYEVMLLTQKVDLQMTSAENALKGYILTEDQMYMRTYTDNLDKAESSLHDLKNMVIDNPLQSQRVDSLELFAQQRMSTMKEILQADQSEGRETAYKLYLSEKAKMRRENLTRLGAKMILEERALLKKRIDATVQSKTKTIAIVIGSALVIFCLIMFLFTYIKRTFDQQKETEDQIRQNNAQLEQLSIENEQKNWLLSGATTINEAMRGEQEMEELSTNIITEICNYLRAPVGALFLTDEKKKNLFLAGGYAYQRKKGIIESYHLGEGLVGQTALEKKRKLLTDVPDDYIKIVSGLGHTLPKCIYLVPILFEEETIAVIEIGLKDSPDETTEKFLETITESIGVAINSAAARIQLRNLFEQTQQQAEELESQQEELRTTNEELIYKSDQLMASEEELRVQQEELRQTNAELEEKAQQLEERNISVNQAREAMSLKAEELAVSSKYKSEFLANMSHELRTPLNSILILARILKENKPENLTEDQIKYAGVIHNAGTDLLTLINDILDLSKIESGKIDLNIEPVRPQEITQNMESLFNEIARSKKIEFETIRAKELPERLLTDLSRVEQIIKNLLSNAFKFTPEHGKITLELSHSSKSKTYFSEHLKQAQNVISMQVRDTGIGIPAEKQKLIFEAFQQADGSTSRKYGGTGLGLSISRELANILGGEIQIESTPGSGSTFTLFLPAEYATGNQVTETQTSTAPAETISALAAVPEVKPIQKKSDHVLLIVEDDLVFADVLKDYAKEKGFQPILAHSGDTGLEMAFSELPDAIVLDIMLPVMDGWTILKKLKADPRTKHIPVHMMSAGDEKTDKARKEGAIGFLKKPIEKDQLDTAFNLLMNNTDQYNFKTVLLIEDQELQSMIVKEELVSKGIEVVQAFTGQEALDVLKTTTFDCIILDLNLPDISGFDLLDQIKTQPTLTHIPVIINTAMELDQEKISHIMKYTEAMVLKSTKSNNRLIDEVSLFMNKIRKEDDPSLFSISQGKTKNVSTIEKALKDKTVLITDDDMRNIFALSSALQSYDLQIVIANNGREALEKLEENKDIDLVLMDIMMPEMDGYEAMRAIRLNKGFSKVPIIALTAKAMKQDREKCIEAGANDYISKPVDIDQLLSMMRVWLS